MTGARQFAKVQIFTKPTFSYTQPIILPRGEFLYMGPSSRPNYDVVSDSRFIGVVPAAESYAMGDLTPHIQVVLNWFEELKQRVPVK